MDTETNTTLNNPAKPAIGTNNPAPVIIIEDQDKLINPAEEISDA